MRGEVIRVIPLRGFGFIRGEDGLSRFFHAKWTQALVFDLMKEGDTVEFTPYFKDNRYQAHDVRLVR